MWALTGLMNELCVIGGECSHDYVRYRYPVDMSCVVMATSVRSWELYSAVSVWVGW